EPASSRRTGPTRTTPPRAARSRRASARSVGAGARGPAAAGASLATGDAARGAVIRREIELHFERARRRQRLRLRRLGDFDFLDDQELLRGFDGVQKSPDVRVVADERDFALHALQLAVLDVFAIVLASFESHPRCSCGALQP